MNAVPCPPGADGHGALPLVGASSSAGGSKLLAPSCAAGPSKRKRRPAGTPDPDAEVVALSPKTLMESDRYVCEICNQGFQRDQNLQMHRRRHKVPWKLLKRPNSQTTKRVYICPVKSCLHHDPAHALGDLVGIKKHYRRKHCTEKQWRCNKCSKGYAVQSDFKAHMKTCGTRGHCCDCGRVFSRVESFIEHQDTCSAVKRRATQSEGGGERIPAHDGTVDTRKSTESPSQSSDTTQAMSFTQSGMSDTTAKSGDYMNSASNVLEEHARRIQENHPAVPVMSAPAAMPAWLMDHTERNKVAPLQRVPTDHAQSRQEVITWPARADRATHGSTKSQATHCSSNPAPRLSAVISCPEMKRSVHEPSLQLSIGPAIASSSVSPYPDTKPTFRNSVALDTEAAWKDYPPRQFGFTVLSARAEKSSHPATVAEFDATMGQSGVNRRMGGAGPSDYNAVRSVSTCFLTAFSPVESSAGLIVHQSTKKDDGKVNCSTERVSHYNAACARSTSSHHETRLGIHMQESVDPAPRPRATRRGSFTNAQLQPALSVAVTQKKAPHFGVAESDHLFETKLAGPIEVDMKSQNRSATATTGQASCDQTPGKVNAAWSDFLTSARRTTDEARQECEEAQREVARAESLKREAREQLHCAAVEKAYADRAREIAKRHVEISEAELVKAKRLRLRAQAELLQASSQANFSPSFCHSCKSTIQDLTVPSRRSTSTSPTARSMLAPSPTALEQSKVGSRGSTQMVMNPGSDISLELAIGAKHAGHQVATDSHRFYDSANRMSWSSGALWPINHGYRRASTSMTMGEPAPSAGGNRPDRVAVQVPAQSHRRDPIAFKGLDLT